MDLLPQLFTEKHWLRRPISPDRDALFRIYGDPEVMRYSSDPVFTDVETVSELMGSMGEQLALGRAYEWVIVCRGSGELIGTCSVHHPVDERAEVGFLLRRDRWGTGVMRDVLPLLLEFAREELGKTEVWAIVDPENLRCRRLLERFGFVAGADGIYRIGLFSDPPSLGQ